MHKEYRQTVKIKKTDFDSELMTKKEKKKRRKRVLEKIISFWKSKCTVQLHVSEGRETTDEGKGGRGKEGRDRQDEE